MRLPRVRFTVRRAMAAVAAMALVLGAVIWAGKLREARRGYLQRAARHSRGLLAIAREERRMQLGKAGDGLPEWRAELAARKRPWVTCHTRMRAKYLHAARCPWLPVAPDPPEPSARFV